MLGTKNKSVITFAEVFSLILTKLPLGRVIVSVVKSIRWPASSVVKTGILKLAPKAGDKDG